ncbi:unnamed protein product [Clonostachys rosea]|uniref:Uncharacterized protein n=1 Tax=Bionectria ochroleuca TaxID=29856 RepID=A0ABY6V1R7_BIOOC|nr:unnamed protein product [Clonostachys rosea]
MSGNDKYRDIFGPLLKIDEGALVKLGSRVAQKEFQLPKSGGKVTARLIGSFNIVPIVRLDHGLKLFIRVPAMGWGDGFASSALGQSLRSYRATIDLILEKTAIPVATVFEVDESPNNEI